jgi:tRNA-modifying protein YgfZ
MTTGYRSLRESAAWLDLSGRGKVLAFGEDRVRLLHAMTTNHVEGLAEGGGCYAFFLNAQGRILGDANLFRMPDHFLLDTEPETAAKLRAHLDHYIIADDVTLEDVTAGTATIAVEGPRAADLLAALGAPVPDAACGHLAWEDRTVARVDSTGAGGCFIFLPAGGKAELIRQIEAAGINGVSAEDARVVRLEYGTPRYGEDITEDDVPQETQVLRAVHFKKGCYIGQEIVERIRARGHVNRMLVRLTINGDHPPARGTALPGGAITSAAYSPALGKVVALGYVRAESARPGTEFLVDGAPAQVVAFDSVTN